MREIVKGSAPEQAGARKKKRRRKQNMSFYYALVILLVTIVGVVLSLTVLFKTDKIIVTGETPYLEADIIEASGIVMGENIIRANYKDAEKRILDTLLYVETVQIKKKFPTTVVISVTQTKPGFNIALDNGYLIVSDSGKILDQLNNPIDGLLIVYGIVPKTTEPFGLLEDSESNKADILFQIKNAIGQENSLDIKSADISDKYNITLNFEDRIEIQIGNSSNLGYKIRYAQSVLTSNKIGSAAQGYLMIDESGVGHFVSRQSMDEYRENVESIKQESEDTSDGDDNSGGDEGES